MPISKPDLLCWAMMLHLIWLTDALDWGPSLGSRWTTAVEYAQSKLVKANKFNRSHFQVNWWMQSNCSLWWDLFGVNLLS